MMNSEWGLQARPRLWYFWVMALIDEIHESWRTPFFTFIRYRYNVKTALTHLEDSLNVANDNADRYHPKRENIFTVFEETHFNDVRVVIIGHEPYPKKEDATGLAFSAPNNRYMPTSAESIYCALATDIGGRIPVRDNFRNWAGQGVLLLNRALTIYNNDNDEAVKKSWFVFTDAIVKMLSRDSARPLHFMLWGGPAKKVRPQIINRGRRHFIHKTDHPSASSPINRDTFRNCGHFSAVNRELVTRRPPENIPINWF